MAAPHNQLDGVSAIAVNDLDRRAVGVGLPAVPPLHQRDYSRQQIKALVGEVIFMAFTLAGFAVGHPLQHSALDQGMQAFAEQVAGASDMGLEFLETPRAIERLPQHQKRPLLPHHVERALHRAVFGAVAFPGR